MNDMKSPLATLGAIALVAVCCLLPVLIIGGIGVLSGIAWGKAALVLIGVAILLFALGRAAAIARRRERAE